MRKIVVIEFVTLDGVMQAPGGPDEDRRNGFEYGGWIAPYNDATISSEISKQFEEDCDLLLGRRTFDIWAPYWPEQDPQHSFNRATKYVVTRRPLPPDSGWADAERIEGDVIGRITEIKETEGPDLHVYGSSDLLQTLLAGDLVDEIRLKIYPLILGQGIRLFHGTIPKSFRTTSSILTPSGVILAKYQKDIK